MSIFRPAAMVGDAIVFEGKPRLEDISEVSAGAVRLEGCTRRAVIRRLVEPGFADYFEQRARLLTTLDGAGSPRLFRSLADGPDLKVTVEEWVGEVSLRRLLAVLHTRGPTPVGLALHVGRSLGCIWDRFERLGTWPLVELEPDEVIVAYDGRVRARIEPSPGPREHNHGAAVALMNPTFELMSPEQVQGLPLTVRTPMFLIGLMMLECLRGTPNFQRSRPWQLLQNIATGDLPTARTLRPDLPASFAQIVDRCLRPAPTDRFESWSALRDALEAARLDVGVFGPTELSVLMIQLFGPAYFDQQVLADDLESLDFERAAASLPRTTLVPWEPAQRLAQRLPTPVETPAFAGEVVDFGFDGRPMLAVSQRLLVDLRPVTQSEYARFVISTGATSPWGAPTPPVAVQNEPVTNLGLREATAYARWAGKRLPTNREWDWVVRQLGPDALGVGSIWEWTSTAAVEGLIVRGGKWRNAVHLPASATNLSWESDPAPDVGFRCVGDRK